MNTNYTIEDVENLWEQHADEYGFDFSDEYTLGDAQDDFGSHGYAFVLAQILAIKDDIEAEREMTREEEEQDFIDFEKDF